MKLLIVTQKVDATDSNLGFSSGGLKFAKYADITVIANEVHTDAGTTRRKTFLFFLSAEERARPFRANLSLPETAL